MKKLFRKDNGGEHDFWMSYTDLMSGFLVIFIVASLIYYKRNEDYKELVSGYSSSEIQKMINDYDNKGQMVNINESFKDIFRENIKDEKDGGYEFMPDSVGSIRFYPCDGDTQMFEKDKFNMMPNLKRRIILIGRPFVQRAMQLKDEGKNIQEIRIEGHTDTDGDFIHNMDLSSKRAFAVYQCIHDSCGLSPIEKKFVETFMISVGYSYAKTVIGESPIDTKNKSRRIEFRIISK